MKNHEQNLECTMKYLLKGATKASSADIHLGLILHNIKHHGLRVGRFLDYTKYAHC